MQDGTFLCKMVFVSLLHVSYFPRSDIDPEKRQKTPFFIFPGTYHCTWHALCYDRHLTRQSNQFSIRSCFLRVATTLRCRAIGRGSTLVLSDFRPIFEKSICIASHVKWMAHVCTRRRRHVGTTVAKLGPHSSLHRSDVVWKFHGPTPRRFCAIPRQNGFRQ